MDIKHFYREGGQGDPLVLLHGNGEDSGYFVHQMEAFSPYFHVYAVDTRGHGQTPRGVKPFTIRQFANDLLGFLDERDVGTTHILGFSDGANIAMVFAMTHPERVGKLVLNGGNLDAKGVKRRVQLPIELGYRAASLFAGVSRKAKGRAELLGLMVNDPNLRQEDLARIKAETLVIAGTDDMIEEAHTCTIAAGLPHGELSILPGDHFLANRRPETFNQVVLDFLTR